MSRICQAARWGGLAARRSGYAGGGFAPPPARFQPRDLVARCNGNRRAPRSPFGAHHRACGRTDALALGGGGHGYTCARSFHRDVRRSPAALPDALGRNRLDDTAVRCAGADGSSGLCLGPASPTRHRQWQAAAPALSDRPRHFAPDWADHTARLASDAGAKRYDRSPTRRGCASD